MTKYPIYDLLDDFSNKMLAADKDPEAVIELSE